MEIDRENERERPNHFSPSAAITVMLGVSVRSKILGLHYVEDVEIKELYKDGLGYSFSWNRGGGEGVKQTYMEDFFHQGDLDFTSES